MSQRSIYEYDAKKLFAQYSNKSYDGKEITDIHQLEQLSDGQTYVIKPDHLFGKRGKHGLVWVNLSTSQLKEWFIKHYNTSVTIGSKTGILTHFMVEPCVPHDQEYYIACSTSRDYDIVYFSTLWGVDVEEQWDTIKSVNVSPLESLDTTMIQSAFDIIDQRIIDFMMSFFGFFRAYWFTYLEVNPFVFDQVWQIQCLDMVAKVDDCEQFNQRIHRGDLSIPLPFGGVEYEAESVIRSLDEKTGASLKCTIINPNGSIWLILWGGWASVIVMDTLTNLWLVGEIANYGELSGNPSTEYNTEYCKVLIKQMLESTSSHSKTLCIIGGIANFTHIDNLFIGIKNAIDAYKDEILQQQIKILVRRWWINDTEALRDFATYCNKNMIPVEVYDGDTFLTKPLNEYQF